MIFDDLVTTTKAMQDLQKKTAIKNNKAMQDNADTKYRLLLTQANHFVDVMVYLYTDLNVPKNHEILMSMVEAICGFDKCYSQYFGGYQRDRSG